MLGTIPISEALTLQTPDADDCNDCPTVHDLTDTKRRSPHYPELLNNIRQHGITTPVVIRDSPDGRYLADGHHRVTAARDAGLTHIPWTDDWILAGDIATMPWQLTLGIITSAAIEAFTRGACAGLAIALHDATGWPIIEVGHCDGLPLHFMVRRPDGRLLDIRGTHSDTDVCDEWEFDADDGIVTLTEATRSDVLDCYRIDCREPVPMDLVHTFVPAVLALASKEPAMPDYTTDEPTPAEAALVALADINTVWANWTSGRLDTDDAMATIRDHLTTAREQGALK